MTASAHAAWRAVQQQAQRFGAGGFDLRHALAHDAQRVAQHSLSLNAPDDRLLLHADWSKAHVDAQAMQALYGWAQAAQLPAQRAALFAGEPVNASEQRAAMHWLLRCPCESVVPQALHATWRQAQATRQAFSDFAQSVRANAAITDVVHIGIGGSELGPRMAVQALGAQAGKRFHFVSNIDGHALDAVLRRVQPAHTLFIIASKTFSTQETMHNAHSALQWFAQNGGSEVAAHFVGITSEPQAAAALGLRTCFGFAHWVGGRYSLWSAIGLPLAIAIGPEGFAELLAGAHALDLHFAHAPAQANLPLTLGLLDAWYASALGYGTRCIVPYHQDLHGLLAYLQQLEMESNGKAVRQDGSACAQHTAPVIWGETGTNAQHAFFELLHQGPSIVPVEFIAVRKPTHTLSAHHHLLLAHALAQAQALMQGRTHPDAQRSCPGNRPSTFIVLPELSPRTLGALIALYEHRVFVSGALWGINSFDQWGVELGKQLAQDIAQRLHSADNAELDASTAALLRILQPP